MLTTITDHDRATTAKFAYFAALKAQTYNSNYASTYSKAQKLKLDNVKLMLHDLYATKFNKVYINYRKTMCAVKVATPVLINNVQQLAIYEDYLAQQGFTKKVTKTAIVYTIKAADLKALAN